ncbi:MAG: amidase [Rhodospirillales bacterium]|jgi:aspartyl-tRNA(Asn)/glutamyl-tRNA(Gln) amidotransferase subunit A|nr:amidase [Rhodospirillales bacterium]MDP6803906.1 amidase [Rhodospirillales bacterium]
MTDWLDRPLAGIAAGLRAREVTSDALLDAACARHARWESELAAYIHFDEEAARRAAAKADAAFASGADHGPLQGIPISVKDLYGVVGMPTYAGSRRRLPGRWETEGPLVAALCDQSAVIVGKTHMVEFAFGGLGVNAHWGTPRNPWDAKRYRVPGGSSSGAAVSLAEGSALIALGSDTAGSIRVPASMTGCVGLKPTAGRWPLDGIVPLSPTFDTPGYLARTLADYAFTFPGLDAFCRGVPAPEPLPAVALGDVRLGIADDFFWDDCAPGIAEAVEDAVGELCAAGAHRAPFRLEEAADAYAIFRAGGLAAAEFNAFLKAELPDRFDDLDAVVAARMADVDQMPAHEYARRRTRFAALTAAANARFAGVDAIVFPSSAVSPPTVDEIRDPEAYRENNMGALRNTSIANLLGLCAITLPVGRDRLGLPVGLQLMAAGGDDAQLVALALAAERVLGTAEVRIGPPPLGASAGL